MNITAVTKGQESPGWVKSVCDTPAYWAPVAR